MKKAFTLIELLIVVTVLGILTAVVIPQLYGSSCRAKESAAISALAAVRTQIDLYKMQHGGRCPGYYGAMPVSESVCLSQFEYPTAATGHVSASKVPGGNYIYGPYLPDFPRNPFNNKKSILYVTPAETFASKANNSTGWLYRRETGEFRLNKSGTDSAAKAYTDY